MLVSIYLIELFFVVDALRQASSKFMKYLTGEVKVHRGAAWALEFSSKSLDRGCWIMDAETWILELRSWNLHSCVWIVDPRYQNLAHVRSGWFSQCERGYRHKFPEASDESQS